MKNFKKKISILALIVLSFNIINNSVIAEPVVEVTIEPSEPTPQSSVEATANISFDDDIDEVWISYKECNPNICFRLENISMTLLGDVYSKVLTLENELTTYFNYSLAILSNGTWYETDETKVNLKVDSSNGGANGGPSNEDEKGIPSFELILLLIAIIVGIILLKRKR